MRVLGIDPGTGRCGFGVVDKVGTSITPVNYGVIETYKDQSDLERLNIVYEGICELIAAYRPQFMGVETLYFNTNITTGIKVAQARASSFWRVSPEYSHRTGDAAAGEAADDRLRQGREKTGH